MTTTTEEAPSNAGTDNGDNVWTLLGWSLRLDLQLLTVPGVRPADKLRMIAEKYRRVAVASRKPLRHIGETHVLGRSYRFNDRFGAGSIQRVLCSSWRLRDVVRPNGLIIDVGANLGQFTLFSEAYLDAARVISIEPDPSTFELLLQNVTRPEDCVQSLVTESAGPVDFYLSDNPQLSSVVEGGAAGAANRRLVLNGAPLDEILDGLGLSAEPIELLKIDTEGNEAEVLRSADRALDRTRVVLVEMSVFRPHSGSLFAAGHYLESKGFELHDLAMPRGDRPPDADAVFIRSG